MRHVEPQSFGCEPNDRDSVALSVKNKSNRLAVTYVSAVDRFETLRPGYRVVQDELATPR